MGSRCAATATTCSGVASRRWSEGSTTRFVYDLSSILLEFDDVGAQVARYTHGPTIDEPLILERGSTTYTLSDGIGSTTELTDAGGAVTDAYLYDAFGGIVLRTGGTTNAFTYTGRELDAPDAPYYYRARYYEAGLGRFLAEDPLKATGRSSNLYAYGNSNPVNFRDPMGLFPGRGPELGDLDDYLETRFPGLPTRDELGRGSDCDSSGPEVDFEPSDPSFGPDFPPTPSGPCECELDCDPRLGYWEYLGCKVTEAACNAAIQALPGCNDDPPDGGPGPPPPINLPQFPMLPLPAPTPLPIFGPLAPGIPLR